jgi:aquaporin Z
MNKLTAGCIAEFIGTFALTFFGAGAIILAAGKMGGDAIAPSAGLLTVALAHGLILSVMISACMYISGGQFNPAVSIGLLVLGKQPAPQAAAFIVMQLLGSAAAAGLWQVFLGADVANGSGPMLGATIGSLTKAGNVGAVIGIEAILTFALMFSVLCATVDDRAHKLGGFNIGLTVTACILAAGPLTGASMNPARSFGPAVCGNHWEMFHAYIIGPVVGAIVAAVVYKVAWSKR